MIFVFLLATLSNIRLVMATKGCKPRGIGTEGFDMSLYHYGYADLAAGPGYCFSDKYQSYHYMHGGYVTYEGGLFGTANGITDLNLQIQVPEGCTPIVGELPPNYNYDGELTVSNFTMLLTGYFYAEYSGDYTFYLVADDLAYMSFGAGDAFNCCGMKDSVSDPGGFNLIVIWKSESDKSGSITFTLNAGVYYPIRLLYTNRDYAGELSLTYIDPSGVHHSDFAGHVFQFPDIEGGCANEAEYITTTWNNPYTSTYLTSSFTSIGRDGFGTIETIYHIGVPEPHTSTTSSSVIIPPSITTEEISISWQPSYIDASSSIATPDAALSSKSSYRTPMSTIVSSISHSTELSSSKLTDISSTSESSSSSTLSTSITLSQSFNFSSPSLSSSSLSLSNVLSSSTLLTPLPFASSTLNSTSLPTLSSSSSSSSSSFSFTESTTTTTPYISYSSSLKISTLIYDTSSLNITSAQKSSYTETIYSSMIPTSSADFFSSTGSCSEFSYHKTVISSMKVPTLSPNNSPSSNSIMNSGDQKSTSIVFKISSHNRNNHTFVGSNSCSINSTYTYSNKKITKSLPTSSDSNIISGSLTQNSPMSIHKLIPTVEIPTSSICTSIQPSDSRSIMSSKSKEISSLCLDVSPQLQPTSVSILHSSSTPVTMSSRTSPLSTTTATTLESTISKNTSHISTILSTKSFKYTPRSSIEGISTSIPKTKTFSTAITTNPLSTPVISTYRSTILSSGIGTSTHNTHKSPKFISSDSVHPKYPSYSNYTEYPTISTNHNVKKSTYKVSQPSKVHTNPGLLSSLNHIPKSTMSSNSILYTSFLQPSKLFTTVSSNRKTVKTPIPTYENSNVIQTISYTTLVVHDSSKIKISSNSIVRLSKTLSGTSISTGSISCGGESISNTETVKEDTYSTRSGITNGIISQNYSGNPTHTISETNPSANPINNNIIVQNDKSNISTKKADLPFTEMNQKTSLSNTKNPTSSIPNVSSTTSSVESGIMPSSDAMSTYCGSANRIRRSHGVYGFLISNIWLLCV